MGRRSQVDWGVTLEDLMSGPHAVYRRCRAKTVDILAGLVGPVARTLVNTAQMSALSERFPKMQLVEDDPAVIGFAPDGPTKLTVRLN